MIYNYEDILDIEDKRVVLLNIGGLESSILSCFLGTFKFEVHHVFINYGQSALEGELAAVHNLIKAYGGTLHECKVELPWLKDHSVLCSGETVKEYDVPKTMGAVIAGTYVPLRNHVFLSIAGSLAESLGIHYIASGLDGSQDIFGNPLGATPDKHPNFAYALENSINEGSTIKHRDNSRIELLAPILGLTKEDTILFGKDLGCDFSLSWSCYNSGSTPCGECCACVDKKLHFENVGETEPEFRKII